MSNVHYLHGGPTPIARFLRVSEHRKLDQLLEANKLPYTHFVVEAGYYSEQQAFVGILRQHGHQVTLDTNIAELSAIARFSGRARHAPWAGIDEPLTEAHLLGSAGIDVMNSIARFAVANGFSRVLAANHFLPDVTSSWLRIDAQNCVALRRALDREGGQSIALDYSVMIPNNVLNDGSQRNNLTRLLASLPVDSIWLRVSGFGADATASGLKKYIVAVRDFHCLNKLLVADGVGGMSGLAVVAFGAASGLAYGVASKERFDASSWHKPPKPNQGGGGGGHSILLAGIDSLLKREDAAVIVGAPGGRRLCSCDDRACCPCGFEDTLKNPKRHFLRQRAIRCDAIAAVPEPVRIKHFLDKDLREADTKARALAKLKLEEPKVSTRLNENMLRYDRMRDVLSSFESTSESATRSVGLTTKTTTQMKDNRRP